MGMHLAEKRPGAGWLIHILHDHHPRRRNLLHVLPPVGSLNVTAAHQGRVCGTNPTSGRISHQGRKAFEKALNTRGRKTFVPQSDAEALDGIIDETSVERPEFFDLLGSQWNMHDFTSGIAASCCGAHGH